MKHAKFILPNEVFALLTDTIKLSVNEARLTGLWATDCATIQQVLLSKFAFGPEKFKGPFEKRAQRL